MIHAHRTCFRGHEPTASLKRSLQLLSQGEGAGFRGHEPTASLKLAFPAAASAYPAGFRGHEPTASLKHGRGGEAPAQEVVSVGRCPRPH